MSPESNRPRHALVVAVILVLLAAFVAGYVAREECVYFWDSANYQGRYQELGSLVLSNPVEAFYQVRHSIRHEDYNHLPILPLLPVYLLFGGGRLAFILAVFTILAVPAILSFLPLTARLCLDSPRRDPFAVYLLTVAALALFPQFLAPVLYGYVGVGGVIVMNLLNDRFIREPFERKRYPEILLTAAALGMLVLFRRWYAYWVVAFLVAVAVERGIAILGERGLDRRRFADLGGKLLGVGLASAGFLFVVAWPIASRMLRTDYSDIYSAYKHSSGALEALKRSYYYFGAWTLALGFLGLALGLADRKRRSAFRFLLIQLVVTAVLFLRTQDFGSHQYYMLMPILAVGTIFGLTRILGWLRDRRLQAAVLIVFVLGSLLGHLVVLVPGTADRFAALTPAFSHYRQHPQRRNDLPVLRRMIEYLETTVEPSKESVYVIASSVILNDSILQNACDRYASEPRVCESILTTSDVDKRDGFPHRALAAKYVLVGRPTQYHMRPEDSRLIGMLADAFTDTGGFGGAFEMLPASFTLDDGVVVEVYRKRSAIPPPALRALSAALAGYYPDRQEIYRIPAFLSLQFVGDAGDGGAVEIRSDHVFLHPGTSSPTRLTIRSGPDVRRLSMTLRRSPPRTT